MDTTLDNEKQALFDILVHYVRFDGRRVIWLTPVFDLLVQQRVYLALLCVKMQKMDGRIFTEERTPLQIAVLLGLPENNSSIRVSLLRLTKNGLTERQGKGYVAKVVKPLSSAKYYN